MSSSLQSEVLIRAATANDGIVCGQICYEAFAKLNAKHGFPCDFPGPEAASGLLSIMFSSPGFYCVVAENAGRVVEATASTNARPSPGWAPLPSIPMRRIWASGEN